MRVIFTYVSPFCEWLDVKKPYNVYVNIMAKQELLYSDKNGFQNEKEGYHVLKNLEISISSGYFEALLRLISTRIITALTIATMTTTVIINHVLSA